MLNFRKFVAASIVAGLMSAVAPAYARMSGTFHTLQGVWQGAGRILLTDGQSQRVRCRAYYRVDDSGSEVGLAIRCAATDNRIELRASVSDSDGLLSGSWEERTYNATGEIRGRAEPGKMDFSIDGAVRGSMKISYSRRQQSVYISTAADGLRGISIDLRR